MINKILNTKFNFLSLLMVGLVCAAFSALSTYAYTNSPAPSQTVTPPAARTPQDRLSELLSDNIWKQTNCLPAMDQFELNACAARKALEAEVQTYQLITARFEQVLEAANEYGFQSKPDEYFLELVQTNSDFLDEFGTYVCESASGTHWTNGTLRPMAVSGCKQRFLDNVHEFIQKEAASRA